MLMFPSVSTVTGQRPMGVLVMTATATAQRPVSARSLSRACRAVMSCGLGSLMSRTWGIHASAAMSLIRPVNGWVGAWPGEEQVDGGAAEPGADDVGHLVGWPVDQSGGEGAKRMVEAVHGSGFGHYLKLRFDPRCGGFGQSASDRAVLGLAVPA